MMMLTLTVQKRFVPLMFMPLPSFADLSAAVSGGRIM
jgi:hypothetical protein